MRICRLLAMAVVSCIAACVEPDNLITKTDPVPDRMFVAGPTAEYDVAPHLLSGKAPIYPASQLMNGKGGRGTIAFTIGTDGRTRDIRILESTYPYYGIHLAAAARDWRFRPALKNGEPVEFEMRYTLNFETN